MTEINVEFYRMIAEMRQLGEVPAPGNVLRQNSLLRYREAREKILERFLAVFADGYRMGKEDDAPTITSSGWVSVEERLPDTAGEFLVVYHPCYWDNVSAEICIGIDSFRGKTAWAKRKYQRVTHWMPLPEPPKED